VPIASLMGKYHTRESKIYENRLVRAFTQDFMWIWGNEEEGIGYYGSFKALVHKIIYSECFRNPVNNLRYVPILSFKINKEKVRFVGSLGNYGEIDREEIKKYDSDDHNFWSLTYHGIYSNFRVHFEVKGVRYRFWIGWKIYPEDMYGLPEWSHRNASVGFATQLKKIGVVND
jgi:hypothetical protein